jgi:hypothetical protein
MFVLAEFTLLDMFLVLFWLFVVFVVVALFAYFFADIWRRDDISGAVKALWILVILLFPFIGILVYLIARPQGAIHPPWHSK